MLAVYYKRNISWSWIMLYFKDKNRSKKHDISYILIWTMGSEVLVCSLDFVRYCMYFHICIEIFVIQIDSENNTIICERYIIQIQSLHRCKTIFHYFNDIYHQNTCFITETDIYLHMVFTRTNNLYSNQIISLKNNIYDDNDDNPMEKYKLWV